MRSFWFWLIILIFALCNKSRKPERRLIDDTYVETIFLNDSTYQGLTKYYSMSNVLENETEFKNGIKNGYSKNYYSNGRVRDSMTFVNGLAHGYHFVYDSTSHLEYKDYFYNGRKVGGVFFYDQGRIIEYDFLSFDEVLLFKAKYDEKAGVNEFGGQIINMRTSTRSIDNRKEDVIFLYVLNPPNITVKYSIGIFDSTEQKRENYKIIESGKDMFVEMVLPKVRDKLSYFLQADYADSLNNYFKVHISPIIF